MRPRRAPDWCAACDERGCDACGEYCCFHGPGRQVCYPGEFSVTTARLTASRTGIGAVSKKTRWISPILLPFANTLVLSI